MSISERIKENLNQMVTGKEQQATAIQAELNVLYSVRSNIEIIIADEARKEKDKGVVHER